MIYSKLILSLGIIITLLGRVHAQNNSSKDNLIGQNLFNQHCGSCHNFEIDGIGPQLGGITDEVSKDWMMEFIKNPSAKINAKDSRALALLKKYRAIMPSFNYLSDAEITSIISYMAKYRKPKTKKQLTVLQAISNPVVPKISLSDLVVNLDLVAEIPYSSSTSLHTRIAKMDFAPHTKENYIMDLRGKLYQIKGQQAIEYLDMAQYMPHFIHQPGLATGFGSFAFHPDFRQNGLLYTTHTEKPHTTHADFAYADSIKVALQWVISEWKTADPQRVPFSGTHRELFRINMVAQLHGVQEITFNPLAKKGDTDYGMLYIGIGDGGCVENGFAHITHSPQQIWGSIIRINPLGNNSKNGKYGIPSSNPFVNKGGLGEMYAYGFRNPHRITWTKSGKMLATNIGQRNIESVNQILPGNDYGWPIREGTFQIFPDGDINQVYPLPTHDKQLKITYPIAQFDHDEGNAISGGYEYTGTTLPKLKGKYLFGEIVNGRLFYINVADIQVGKQVPIREWRVAYQGKITTFQELTKEKRIDLRFGRDSTGEMYIFTKPDGKVYKMAK